MAIARAGGVPLIVNDRVDIAISLGADGVHIGRNDANIQDTKKRLPGGMILGASATNYTEALEMDHAGADYLGVGPIFPTGSKSDATPPIGPKELARICRAVSVPVVAIGGINSRNLRQIVDAGASGAAVIAAVGQASNVVTATVGLKIIWKDGERLR